MFSSPADNVSAFDPTACNKNYFGLVFLHVRNGTFMVELYTFHYIGYSPSDGYCSD